MWILGRIVEVMWILWGFREGKWRHEIIFSNVNTLRVYVNILCMASCVHVDSDRISG